MITVYIDSTLKHEWNVTFNIKICEALEAHGLRCHLPQRDTNQSAAREAVYNQNLTAIRRADIVLAIANNESPNWGVEVGYAHARGVRVIALSQADHDIPLMARYMISDTLKVSNLDNIEAYIEELVAILK